VDPTSLKKFKNQPIIPSLNGGHFPTCKMSPLRPIRRGLVKEKIPNWV
jgi:hypothetical protein